MLRTCYVHVYFYIPEGVLRHMIFMYQTSEIFMVIMFIRECVKSYLIQFEKVFLTVFMFIIIALGFNG